MNCLEKRLKDPMENRMKNVLTSLIGTLGTTIIKDPKKLPILKTGAMTRTTKISCENTTTIEEIQTQLDKPPEITTLAKEVMTRHLPK